MASKENIQDIYRLSPIQEGILFHCIRHDENPVYIEQFSYVVNGNVSSEVVDNAWQMTIARHDILRSGFIWQGVDKPVQVVFKTIPFTLQVLDYSSLDDAQYQQKLAALKEEQLHQSFELKKPPLMSFAVIYDPQGNTRMLWTYHHILLDGWSAFLVLGDVLNFAAQLSNGVTPTPAVAPSYKQFVKWQQQQDEQAAIAYWTEVLGDFSAPTPLGIPSTLDRPAIDSTNGDYLSLSFELGAAFGSTLEQVAQQLRVTVSTLLQAAWAWWLIVSSREDDVVFGVTLSGRSPDLAQSDKIAGMFINTLPCRVALPEKGTVLKDWLHTLQQQFVRLRQFEYSPLTTVRGCTQLSQDANLFDAMLAIESFPLSDTVAFDEVEVTQKTNYPFTMVVEPQEQYRARIMFDTAHFTPDVIRNVFQQYQTILQQFPNHLNLPVSDLSLMSTEERALQNQWNDTTVEHPGYSLSERFAHIAATRENALAIVEGMGENRREMTYGALDKASSQLARHMINTLCPHSKANNPLAGEHIALCYRPSIEQMVAMVAIVKLGAAYVPIDSTLPAQRMQEMVGRIALAAIITDDHFAPAFVDSGLPVIDTVFSAQAIDKMRSAPLTSPLVPKHVLYIAHTSGSTGIPKAAGVYHDSFVNLLHWWNNTYGYRTDDKNLLINKLSFDLAQKNVWGSLLTGGEQHVFTGERFDPQAINAQIHASGITWINCTPSMGYALVESAMAIEADISRCFVPLRTMRYLFLGGEPVNKARVAPWMLDPNSQVQLVNTYGPTECTDLCCTHWFEREEFERLDDLVTVGKALPINLHLYVLDRFGKPCPRGIAGEVMIGGMSIGTGYLNSAEQTAEKFVPDLYGPTLALDPNPISQSRPSAGRTVPGLSEHSNSDNATLYHTGDLGYFRNDGTLVVKGRVDFQVKLRGNRIELEEIDVKIRELAEVDDAVTVISDDGQRLYSYVVPQLEASTAQSVEEDAQQQATEQAFKGTVLEGKAWVEFGGEQAEPAAFIAQFEAMAETYADNLAVRSVVEQLTYAELNAQANQWARYWLANGLKTGDIVGLYMARDALGVALTLGLMKIGVAFIPMDDMYPPERLQYMLTQSRAKYLISYIPQADSVPHWFASLPAQETACIVVTPADIAKSQALERDALSPEESGDKQAIADALVYLIFTSGSTGKPKGVAIEQRTLARFAVNITQAFNVSETSRVLQFSPLSFDAWLMELCCGLTTGASLCLLTPDAQTPSDAMLQQVAQLRADHALIPPSVLSFLPPESLPTLTHLMVGGEPCSLPLAKRWAENRCLYQAYGVSELTVISSMRLFDPTETIFAIGEPLVGTHFYLLDEHQQPVSDGAVGELYVGGNCLAREYIHQPELTQERFIPDPFVASTTGDTPRMYRTGDLLRRLPDGGYEFVNRADGQVKVNGFRVEVGEYEAVFADVEGIAEAVVVAQEVIKGNYRLGAFIKLAADVNTATLEPRLASALQRKLPTMPAAVMVIEDWPRTPNNKIDRAALLAKFAQAAEGNHNAALDTTLDATATNDPEQEAITTQWPAIKQAVLAHLKASLPSYMVPSVIVHLPVMPLNANGKVDRSSLPAIDDALLEEHHETVAPRNELEVQIHEIWQEILGRKDIGVTDNFFELGGHSLSITQTLSRLNRQFEQQISLSQLFEHLTIEKQAKLISGEDDNAQPSVGFERLARPAQLPLSYSQSRLWFLNQFENLPAVYNIPNVLSFSGVVDVARLQTAINQLVQRHESLRTTFAHAEQGDAQQIIHASLDIPLEYIDAAQLDEGQQADLVRRTATEQVMTDFNLHTGPLARFALVQQAVTEPDHAQALLFFTMHHIVTDGWSGDIMARELRQLYDAPQQTLPAITAHYADYAVWQRHAMQSGQFDTQKAYWLQQLDGATQTLALPYDHARPATMSNQGGLYQQLLGRELSDRLKQLAQRQEVTLFMLLKTVFDALLYRYSGQSDFCVGTPIANRHQQALESTVGFFVNTLVLRSQIEPQWTFTELLAHVKHTAAQAFDHQDMPFEALVELLNPTRDAAFNPLFQVMFTLQTAQGNTSMVSPDEWVSRFDLQLMVVEESGALTLSWEYSTDVFTRETIQRMADSFAQLASFVTKTDASASVPLSQWLLLTERQQKQLNQWAEADTLVHEHAVFSAAWQQQVAATPDNLAVSYRYPTDNRINTLSHQQLWDATESLAQYLYHNHRNVVADHASDTPVAIAMQRGLPQLIAILAAMRAGVTLLAIDVSFPKARIQFYLDDANVALILCDEPSQTAVTELAGSTRQITCVDAQGQAAAPSDAGVLPCPEANSVAYWIYTSGSTGTPKAIRVKQSGILNTLVSINRRWQMSAQSRMLQFASVSFDAFWLEMGALLAGGSVHLIDQHTQTTPDLLGECIEQQQISHAFLLPSLLNYLPIERCDSLVQLMVGGEACPLELAEQWSIGRRFLNGYGPSEVSAIATVGEYQQGSHYFPIGTPLHNVQCYVLDTAQQASAFGCVGELYIGGAGVALGYANRESLTAERFIHLPTISEGPLYRTGDLVKWLPEGGLLFVGRVDTQLKLRGQRLEAGEIEYQLAQVDFIKDAIVIKKSTANGELLHAWLLVEDIDSLTAASVNDAQDNAVVHYLLSSAQEKHIKTTLQDFLPAYMVPTSFAALALWPKLPNGKVNHALLHDIQLDVRKAYVAAETATQRKVQAIWQHIMPEAPEAISIEDDFFALGGHSLLATKLMAQVFNEFGYSVPLKDFFLQPTIKFMATYIDAVDAGNMQRVQREAAALIPWELDAAIDLPKPLPSFAQHRISRFRDAAPHILLTGCTGFLGAYLLRELIQRWSNATVHCHVRATTAEQGLQRIQDNLSRYGLWNAQYAANIQVVLGDLEQPKLGIADAHWQRLAECVDVIVHNGAIMNHMAHYDHLKNANLRSTKQLLALAAEQRLKQFMLVSTLGILEKSEKKRQVDEHLDIRNEALRVDNGYNGTKWVAELAAMQAFQQGVPVQIVRPGRIVFDADTGAAKLDDIAGYYLSTQILSGKIPRYKFEEPVVPVNYVAQSIVAVIPEQISFDGSNQLMPEVYHLSGKQKYNWSKVIPEHVQTKGQFETLSIQRWVDEVKRLSQDTPLPFAPYLFHIDTDNEEPEPKRTTIKEQHTVAALAKRGVEYPKLTQSAWRSYLLQLFDAAGVRFEFQQRRLWQVFKEK